MRQFLSSIVLLLASAFAFCQAPEPTVALSKLPTQSVAGSKITIIVTITFAEGFHGYQNPPASEYEIPVDVKIDGKEFKVLKIAYPPGVDATIGGGEKPTKAYEGTIKVPVTVQLPTTVGKRNFKVVVKYQQCDTTSCFPPGQVQASTTVNVVKKVSKP